MSQCPKCGQFVVEGDLFCMNCGARMADVTPTKRSLPIAPPTVQKKLCRSQRDKIVLGVCGGIADFLGIDPAVVRLIFILAAVMSLSLAIVFYFVMAVVMPVEGS